MKGPGYNLLKDSSISSSSVMDSRSLLQSTHVIQILLLILFIALSTTTQSPVPQPGGGDGHKSSLASGNLTKNGNVAPQKKDLLTTVPTHTVVFPAKGKKVDSEEQIPDSNSNSNPEEQSDANLVTGTFKVHGYPTLDETAIKGAFIVFAALGTVVLLYFGVKFACVKKRPKSSTSSRYGLVEASEMDLLETADEDDTDEDDTLFDLHSHRRT